jgi:hypothetical protein
MHRPQGSGMAVGADMFIAFFGSARTNRQHAQEQCASG